MKCINYLRLAIIIFGISVVLAACGGSKSTTGAPHPSRGSLVQAEPCEEKAMEPSPNLRDAGQGISDREAFATNLALLDARAKLAQQITVLVNGLTRNFNQQHEAGVDQLSSVAKAGQIQEGYFEEFLAGSRQICKNAYYNETTRRWTVYVTVELDENQQRAMHRKLTDDKMIQIDFQEHLFLEEMQKARNNYRQQR